LQQHYPRALGSDLFLAGGVPPGYARSMTRLGELMAGAVVSVAPEDTLGEAAERMAEQAVGSAVVLDGGRLIGILTERDLLGAVAGRVHTSEARVREWMTVDPVTAREDMSVDEAIRTMLERGFRHLPVVESGRTVGIVSLRECMKAELQVDIGAEGPTD
jgi:CBS domain-containing protein